jgi:co-chaperonin GroES (HSP10)
MTMTTEQGLLLPSGMMLQPGALAPKAAPQTDEEFENTPMEERGRQIPTPVGFKLLCAIPQADDHFENSKIIKADVVKRNEEIGTTVLFVYAMGPQAYQDPDKFPEGPWCKTGDFILVRTYTGTRFKIRGTEWRLINDDQVEAVVDDPRGITRAAA